MNDPLLDRIKAHRSAPDVYDPPTFDQMADRILELEAKRADAEAAVNAAADIDWDDADDAMNKDIIEEYNRMKKERNDLYVRSLNLKIGSGFRMVRDELHAKEANIKKYMWVHGLTDDFVHDL
jgi:hypothetical protein